MGARARGRLVGAVCATAIVAALTVAGTSADAGSPAACAGASATLADAGSSRTASTLRCVLNAERERRGLRRLRAHGDLTLAARRHTRAQLRRGELTHVIGRSTPARRARRAGYLEDCRRWSVGEVLADATGSLANPEVVVDAWLASPEHRAVILARDLHEVGLGLADRTAEGARGLTVTAVLGRCRR